MVRVKSAGGATVIIGILSTVCANAATVSWNTDASGNWETDANWSLLPPAAGDQVNVDRTTAATTITLNTSTETIGIFNLGNTNGKYGGLLVTTGGSLNSTAAVRFGNAGNASVTQDDGAVTTTGAIFVSTLATSVSTYTMTGGTMTAGTDFQISQAGNGLLDLRGGTITWGGVFQVGKTGIGKAIVSGGTLGNNLKAMSVGSSGQTGGTLEIVGSAATIDPTAYTQYAGNTLSLKLDNGGVSPIKATSVNVTNAVLNVGFKGGAALLKDSSFKIIESTGNVVGAYATTPDANMWTSAAGNSAAGFGYRITLAAGANKTGIDAATGGESVFAAAAKGHLTLTNVDTLNPLSIHLDVDPGTGTLGDLMTYFGDSDFTVSTSSVAGYDLTLTAIPSAATQYFAWDLSGLTSGATLSQVAVFSTVAVPEPTTIGLVAAGSVLALRRRRA